MFFTSAICNPEINVGTTLDLSRGAKQLGNNIKLALELAFKNTQGENRFNLSYYDDRYVPEIARKNVEDMIQKNIKFLLCPIYRLIEAYADLIKKRKIVVIFPLPSIPVAENLNYCINFGPTYKEYAQVVTQYIVNKKSPKKIVILYQDDTPGKLLLTSSLEILKKAGITTIPISFEPNNISLKEQVKKTMKAKPDCIGIFGPPHTIRKYIKRLGDIFCNNKTFFVSALEDSKLLKFMKDKKNLKFTGANTVPDPQTSTIPIVAEFREAIKDNHIAPDVTALQAYICASIFVEICSTKLGPSPSPESCINAFENLKNYNFKGINLTFNPKTRWISNKVWLYTLDNTWEEKSVGIN